MSQCMCIPSVHCAPTIHDIPDKIALTSCSIYVWGGTAGGGPPIWSILASISCWGSRAVNDEEASLYTCGSPCTD
jgi:hypothetical protein